MEKTKQKKWADMSPEEKKKNTRESIIALIVAIPLIMFVVGKCSDDYSTYNNIGSSAQRYVDNNLKNSLKCADGWEYEKKALSRIDSITYKFTAVVLARNSFGVRGRMLYNMKIEFVGSKKDSYKDSDNPSNWKIVTNELVE